MVAAWPRRVALTQVLLTGPVPRAVWVLMSRCGLAVPGHRVRRVSSQARSRRAVRSSRGRGWPPRSRRRLPGSASAEAQGAGGAAAGRVDAGQGHDEPGRRGDGSGDGVVDVVLVQRLQDGGDGPPADLDAAGGVAEDHAGREAEPEQRAQGHQGVMALRPAQVTQAVLDVFAGDLAEVAIVQRPVRQRGQRLSQVTVDGRDAAGTAAGASVFEGAQPALDVAADPAGHAVELAVQPGVEGGAPVVVQHAHLPEDLGDVPGAQAPGQQRRQDPRPPDILAFLVAGQRDGQSLADPAPDLAGPAVRFGEAIGGADRGGQGRAGRRAAAGAGGRRQQIQLNPGGLRGECLPRAACRAARRPGSRARRHPVEEQLMVADLHAGPGQRGDRLGRGAFPGMTAGQLDPAQPAVPVLHPQRPAAPGALALARMTVAERAACPAPRSLQHPPGQAVDAAAGTGAGGGSSRCHAGGMERPSRRLGVTAGPPAAGAAA